MKVALIIFFILIQVALLGFNFWLYKSPGWLFGCLFTAWYIAFMLKFDYKAFFNTKNPPGL